MAAAYSSEAMPPHKRKPSELPAGTPGPLPACLQTALPCLPPCLQVLEYIEDSMPPESAAAFGLHPNAEIGFKLREAAAFCSNLQTLQVGGVAGHEGWQKVMCVPAAHFARQLLALMPACLIS